MRKSDDPKSTDSNDPAAPVVKKSVVETVPGATPVPEISFEYSQSSDMPADEQPVTDEPHHDDERFDESTADFHPREDPVDDPGHRTLAATALMTLVGTMGIGSLTLWAAPKLAPHLPASVAQYLMPGQIETASKITDVANSVAVGAAKSDTAIAGLNAQIAALAGRLDATATSDQTAAITAAAQSATDAASVLATRLDTVEAELAALRDEFTAVSSALTDAGTGTSTASPELAAAVAALGARLESLATSVDAGTAAVSTRLDTVEASAATALEVQNEALGEASSAIHQARLQAAINLLGSQLATGLPYGEGLNDIAELTGTAPPDALSAMADSGLATAAALDASFGRHAQAAVAADVQASAGEGSGQQALGWLRAQIAGRPTNEQQGDSVGAITSRIAARVKDGELADALTEVETLPAHAQTGLGDWLDQLRARVAADSAMADWRAQIGAGG